MNKWKPPEGVKKDSIIEVRYLPADHIFHPGPWRARVIERYGDRVDAHFVYWTDPRFDPKKFPSFEERLVLDLATGRDETLCCGLESIVLAKPLPGCVRHKPVGIGHCSYCGHYGKDCTGEAA